MKQDLTIEEILWKFDVLQDQIGRNLDFGASDSEVCPEFDVKYIILKNFISASLMYLDMINCANITLYSEDEKVDALFFSTKEELLNHRNDMHKYDKTARGIVIDKEIYVPNIFENDNDVFEGINENYTHIALSFVYPQNQLGRFIENIVTFLRKVCKNDYDVINLFIFMETYYKHNPIAYYKSVGRIMYLSMFEFHYTSALQYPCEIQSVIRCFIDDEEIGDVYDPFGRTGMNSELCPNKYYVQVRSKESFYSIMLIRAIWGNDFNDIEVSDCRNNWNSHNCQTIFATPNLEETVTLDNDNIIPVGEWVLGKIIDDFKEHDLKQAFLVLPANVLYEHGHYDTLRNDISESGLLNTVVLFPTNLYDQTGIATTLLILKSDRVGDNVTMIDLSNAIKQKEEGVYYDEKEELDEELCKSIIRGEDRLVKKCVSINEIRAKEYDWYVKSYTQESVVRKGFKKVKLSDLLIEYEEFEPFPSIKNIIIKEDDLVDEPFVSANKKSIISQEEFMERYDPDNFWFLSENTLVVEFIPDNVRTAWYEEESKMSLTHVCVDTCLDCYKVNKDEIDIDYLRLVLSQINIDFTPYIVDNVLSGEIIKDKYLNTEIEIPLSYAEQKRIYEDAKYNHVFEQARKAGLEEAISRMKDEYISEVRMRKHDMKPFISQLDSLSKIIPFYLDKIEGNDEVVSAIRAKVDGMSVAVDELRQHLNRLTEEDIYGSPEPVNIVESMLIHKGEYANYSIDVRIDELALNDAMINEPLVYISPVDLSTLVNTIVENAVTHAFDGIEEGNKILINVGVDKDKEAFVIDFKNNGKPMPIGMDKYRYGLKGEKGARSKGSGLGGYRVKSIVRHYGGDYDVFCKRNGNSGNTTIRVELPIYKNQ